MVRTRRSVKFPLWIGNRAGFYAICPRQGEFHAKLDISVNWSNSVRLVVSLIKTQDEVRIIAETVIQS
jgi:hypothetical protein